MLLRESHTRSRTAQAVTGAPRHTNRPGSRPRSAATTASGAVSARSTCGPDREPRHRVRERLELGRVEAALGADEDGPARRARIGERGGGQPRHGPRSRGPGRPTRPASSPTGATSGTWARRHWAAASRAIVCRRATAAARALVVPADDAAPGPHRLDARDAELGAPGDDVVEPALRQREREPDRGHELGFDARRRRPRRRSSRPGATRGHV